MHLTNYAINKKNPNFIFNKEETQDNLGHKRSFSAILKVYYYYYLATYTARHKYELPIYLVFFCHLFFFHLLLFFLIFYIF